MTKSNTEKDILSIFSYKNVLALISKIIMPEVFADISFKEIAEKYLINEDNPESPKVQILPGNDPEVVIGFNLLTPDDQFFTIFIAPIFTGKNEPFGIVLSTSPPKNLTDKEAEEKVDYMVDQIVFIWITTHLEKALQNKTEVIQLSNPEVAEIGKDLEVTSRPDPDCELNKHCRALVVSVGEGGTGFYALLYAVFNNDLKAVKKFFQDQGLTLGEEEEKALQNFMDIVQVQPVDNPEEFALRTKNLLLESICYDLGKAIVQLMFQE